MLQEWLGSITLDRFCASQLQRTPIAQPATVSDPAGLLDWERVGGVLAAEPGPDVIVCARGQRLTFPPPRDLDALRAYLRMGIGLCIRQAQRCDAVLAAIAAQFERDIGESHVQLFVTPAATHGFGWHFDEEDVFIVQTAGVKDYYFRANTVTTGRAEPSAFADFGLETSPLFTTTLHPGDFLYIPARWWHVAECKETSLSVSVGVYPARPR